MLNLALPSPKTKVTSGTVIALSAFKTTITIPLSKLGVKVAIMFVPFTTTAWSDAGKLIPLTYLFSLSWTTNSSFNASTWFNFKVADWWSGARTKSSAVLLTVSAWIILLFSQATTLIAAVDANPTAARIDKNFFMDLFFPL
ncbi:hypothetical protein LD125_00692 [Mesoplasma sp. JKS002658]|nr:hypothetical protein [Mesoplasma sp. JKS002664]MCL8212411.1 hypothetical protein [Mesoplasma sp. JKS002662]MCL8214428.1 hypothetical protein [Mesoplasma sp. JKS002658]MCL8215087.1 hypothetical protein [Mesoplasma sp. JKS002663]MCL8215750.1 hypothetical protein [Mesoplasma sp. JKS002659]